MQNDLIHTFREVRVYRASALPRHRARAVPRRGPRRPPHPLLPRGAGGGRKDGGAEGGGGWRLCLQHLPRLAFKAHRLWYHSTLDSRVIKKKKKT